MCCVYNYTNKKSPCICKLPLSRKSSGMVGCVFCSLHHNFLVPPPRSYWIPHRILVGKKRRNQHIKFHIVLKQMLLKKRHSVSKRTSFTQNVCIHIRKHFNEGILYQESSDSVRTLPRFHFYVNSRDNDIGIGAFGCLIPTTKHSFVLLSHNSIFLLPLPTTLRL